MNKSNILEFKVDGYSIVVDFNAMEWTSTGEGVTWSLRIRDGIWECARYEGDWELVVHEYQEMLMDYYIGIQLEEEILRGE